MTDPARTALTANTWTKVVDTKKSGIVTIADSTPKFYVYTQIDAGGLSPTDDTKAIQIGKSGSFELDSSVDKDVYVKAIGAAGAVIVEV